MVDGLRHEYLGDLADQLNQLSRDTARAKSGEIAAADLTGPLRRFAFEAKGQSHNLALSLINAVCHRLEDYLGDVKTLGADNLDDVLAFIGALAEMVDGTVDLDADPSEVVRRLPAKRTFEVSEMEVRDVEIMLVMLHGTATNFVQKELQACGYRVNIVTSVFDALPLILRTKPNMIVVSAVMGELSGISLALALSVMPETRNIPAALITSFDRDHDSLAHLPATVPIIKKDASFGDDIAAALEFHFLL